MNYAVIKLAGKQHRVSLNDQITVDRLEYPEGKSFTIKDVLLVVRDGKRSIGTPTVKDTVTATIVEHSKGKKVRVATYRSKSRTRRVIGHRQLQTLIKITAIGSQKAPQTSAKPSKSAAKKKPATAKKSVSKKATKKTSKKA